MNTSEVRKLSAVHTGMAAEHAEAALEQYANQHGSYDEDEMTFVQGLDNFVGKAETYLEELERHSDIEIDPIYADEAYVVDQTIVEHLDDVDYHLQTAQQHYDGSLHQGNQNNYEESFLLEELDEELDRLNQDLEKISYLEV